MTLSKSAPARPLSLPNLLTYARVVAVPVVVALILISDSDWARWTALVVVLVGALGLLPLFSGKSLLGLLRARWLGRRSAGS